MSRLKDTIDKASPELKYTLLIFITTRAALTLIGVLSRAILDRPGLAGFTKYPWLNIWGVWDTGWYLNIAGGGYSAVLTPNGEANYGFFPLYPLLMKLVGAVIGNNYIAGLAISNACLILACLFLYRLVVEDSDEDTARRSIKYLFLFPTAFILSGVFTESLFLMLLVACFYYARRGNWLVAGSLGFFLSLTRSIGVFAILPLFYEYMKSRGFKASGIRPDALCLLLIPAGLAAFMAYNHYLTGDYLAFAHIEATGWGHQLTNPVETLVKNLTVQDLSINFNAWFTVAALAALILGYGKIGFSYWLLGMYSILVPLSGGVPAGWSMSRYILIIFPLFILFAKLGKDSRYDRAVTIAFLLLQGFLMVFWTNQYSLVV
jgi:hypothetical protein